MTGAIATILRCNASTKSMSDVSSVFMELETISVHSLSSDVEVVDVTVVLRGFSSATHRKKTNGSSTLDRRRD